MEAHPQTERRVRRTDLWFAGLLFLGFIIIAGLDMMAENNTREATIAEMRRLQSVVVGQAYKPMDTALLELLSTQDTQINDLLEITRHQALAISGIKKRQDERGPMIREALGEIRKLRDDQRARERQDIQRANPKSVGGQMKPGGKPQ